jgi:hypothetical protein
MRLANSQFQFPQLATAGQITLQKVMTLDPSLRDLAAKVQDCEDLCRIGEAEAYKWDQHIQRNEEIVDNAILAAERSHDPTWKDWTVKAALTGSALTCALIYTLSTLWVWMDRKRKRKEMEGNEDVGVEEAQTKRLEGRRTRLHARSWE